MIYSLLYSSPLFEQNKHRNIYLYSIGTILYAIVHGILYSTIGEKYTFIRKYRSAIYLIALGDLAFVKRNYDLANASTDKQHKMHQHKPIIEEVYEQHEQREQQVQNEEIKKDHPKQLKSVSLVDHEQTKQGTQNNIFPQKQDTSSNNSIPVYQTNDPIIPEYTPTIKQNIIVPPKETEPISQPQPTIAPNEKSEHPENQQTQVQPSQCKEELDEQPACSLKNQTCMASTQ